METKKKFELTDETKTLDDGTVLHRIKALIDFGEVKAGIIGGWIEKETNLSQDGDAWVYGDARVYGDAWVSGNAWVENSRDYIVFKNWWSSFRYFTWTRSNNKWTVGCFHGSGAELIKKAYNDSEESGREYERIVRYVEFILADESANADKQREE